MESRATQAEKRLSDCEAEKLAEEKLANQKIQSLEEERNEANRKLRQKTSEAEQKTTSYNDLYQVIHTINIFSMLYLPST